MTYADGDKYVGEWWYGKKNGKGTLTQASSAIYVGEFRNDMKNGTGTLTFPDGKVQSGIWFDDKYLYDLAEHQKREELKLTLLRQKEKQKKEAQLAAKKQRIFSKLKPYMDDCQNIGFKVDSKKYRECIVESI